MQPCSVEGCGRPVQAGGLCSGHYQRKRRGEPLTPLRTARGEGEQLTIHMSRDLRERAATAAERAGEAEGEWWRNAGEQRLASTPRKPRRTRKQGGS